MALSVRESLEAQHNTESHPEGSFAKYKTVVAWPGEQATLASANLERGDNLPSDSTYEIVGAKMADDKDGDRYVICQGYAEDTTSGSPWSELTGTRKIEDAGPKHVDWVIEFTAATGTAAPVAGDKYADVLGAGTLGARALYDTEPIAVHVSEVTQVTKLKAHVTVRFRAHYRITTAWPIALKYQEIHPRIRHKTGRNHWKCRRRFSCDDGYAANLEMSLDGEVMPRFAGKYAPICEEVQTISGLSEGRSLVVADYETQRVPGEATIRLGNWYQMEKVQREPAGKKRVIEGFDTSDPLGIHCYAVVEGSNYLLSAKTTYIIETAYDKFSADYVAARIGCVNEAKAFGARAGSLMLLGTPHTRWWPKGKIWYYDYHFAYSGPFKVWNDFLKVRKYINISRELLSFDSQGNPDFTAATRFMADKAFIEVTNFVMSADGLTVVSFDKKKSAIESREIFPTASFADLNGWAKW